MNTDVVAFLVCGEGERERAGAVLSDIERLFRRSESALTRFSPLSELSRLNSAAGKPFRASRLLYAAVEQALQAAAITDGLYDPTILPALEAAGYDRSFELIEPASLERTWQCVAIAGWRAVRLDRETRTIAMPAGTRLDLGGIAKGWTADRAARRVQSFAGFAIDAGGDMRIGGRQACGSAWTVGVEDPRSLDRDVCVLEISDAAIATSSRTRRRWLQGGRPRHHLIDPRSGAPARTDVLSATVIAGSAARSEALAKAALLVGPDAGTAFLQRSGEAEGMLVLHDGTTVETPGFSRRRYAA